LIRALTRVLCALILAGVLLVLIAGARQSAPNATRTVIGARLTYCSPDGRFISISDSGWLPTVRCDYPPPVPERGG
jgi:hypothetical protein